MSPVCCSKFLVAVFSFAPRSLVSRIFPGKLRDIGLQPDMQSPPRAVKAMEKTSTMVLSKKE